MLRDGGRPMLLAELGVIFVLFWFITFDNFGEDIEIYNKPKE
jgi:hypothetical protein